VISAPPPQAADMDIPISLGQVKRVLEWCSCSQVFRELIEADPLRAAEEYQLGFDPRLIRVLWDPLYAIQVGREGHPIHPAVREYQEFFAEKVKWRDNAKAECSPSEPRFKAWRARQIARNAVENGSYDNYIIHTPFAIEITDGCTVGCWFCGVGATKFVQPWPYTAENGAMWRETITTLRDVVGDASRWGFCYWATDPLDNPDYEHFANDFCDITGLFPQTTTAQAHKHVERLRALLKVSEARGCKVNRFSVVSERLLKQIHAAFTPDELVKVEIVPQMATGTTPKAAAGAFRERAKTNGKIVDVELQKLALIAEQNHRIAAAADKGIDIVTSQEQPGTIACVSGFLLNMVRKTIKLISPCRATDEWPLGYIVFEERVFTDAADVRSIVEDMIETHMPLEVAPESQLRLAPGLQYERVADGFRLKSPMSALNFQRPDMADYVISLGDRLSTGRRTAGEIALSGFFEHGVPELNTLITLGAMFDQGVLLASKRPGMQSAG
jgi:radical SAM family RiPP maturation amino acid epimerase